MNTFENIMEMEHLLQKSKCSILEQMLYFLITMSLLSKKGITKQVHR